MNEPPPLRNQCKHGSRGAACGRATGVACPPATANTLTGAKLADAALSIFYFFGRFACFVSDSSTLGEKIVIDYTQIANFYSRKILDAAVLNRASGHGLLPYRSCRTDAYVLALRPPPASGTYIKPR